MIAALIRWSMQNRFLVLLATLSILFAGILAVRNIPLDAIPDLSDTQVIIYTEYPGQAPQVVEDQVTYPLTTAMLSVPRSKTVRGFSFFGISFVYIIFEDGTDIYWARSRVLEYLNFATKGLPSGVTPSLGPDATGVGWVYQYALVGANQTLADLRSLQDWSTRYQLVKAEGVAEVASVGGFVRQYQVVVDPRKLQAYNLSLSDIREAVAGANKDVGGRAIELTEKEYVVRGRGYFRGMEDIENVFLKVDNGVPVFLRDVARIEFGPDERRGITELNGEGEVVSGVALQRYGENALDVIDNVKQKITEVANSLPEGVSVKTVYDRSELIHRAVETLTHTLLEESLVVAAVCFIFLLHARSALVAILMLPVGVLIAISIMYLIGVSSNIMSLGGIAIAVGAMVDAAIVMIENAHKHLERAPAGANRMKVLAAAASEVGPALFFSLLVITVSFLPVFTLEAQEGRMFKPLAFTKTFSMAAAALLSITLVPVLMYLFIRNDERRLHPRTKIIAIAASAIAIATIIVMLPRLGILIEPRLTWLYGCMAWATIIAFMCFDRITPEEKNPINRILIRAYRPILTLALRWRWVTLALAVAAMASAWYPLKRIGSEFMPNLNEGTLFFMPTTLPGLSITKAAELLQIQNKIIKSFPWVDSVYGKAGRAATATDPAPTEMFETIINLKPKDQWPAGKSYDDLIAEMDKALTFPGVSNAWTQPIKARIDMLSTGIRTPVGIKLIGKDYKVMDQIARQIEAVIRKVPGTTSVYAERVVGSYYLNIEPNRAELARNGITINEFQDVVSSALGGETVTTTVEGRERYGVAVRYPRGLRSDPQAIANEILVHGKDGPMVPLGQLAAISLEQGPSTIRTENAQLALYIFIDMHGRDIGGYVADAKKAIAEKIQFPSGYYPQWSGQFEYLERAEAKLRIVIPITLMIIFLLLYLNFRRMTETLIVMLSLPFALVGGLWMMYYLGFNMSVAVAVGFIALAGVAAETGVVMLIYLDHALKERLQHCQAAGRAFVAADLRDAIMEGAVERVRPKMMTVVAIMAGLIPILWSDGTGSEVMQRIAVPMIGGMVTSTVLTLIVIPVIYTLAKNPMTKTRRDAPIGAPMTAGALNA